MTKAIVWIKNKNGRYDGLYISGDGYPDCIGEILIDCQNEAEAESELSERSEYLLEYEDVDPESFDSRTIGYLYIFKNGEWYVYQDIPQNMITVKTALKEFYEEDK